MKKTYIEPEIEVISLGNEDIITTSGGEKLQLKMREYEITNDYSEPPA